MLFRGKWHFGHICALETIQKLFTQMFIHYATNFKLSTECSYQLPINLACGIFLQHLMILTITFGILMEQKSPL